MRIARGLYRFGVLLALSASLPGVVACGGGQKKSSSIPKAGEMPEGGNWTGVYFSSTYGYLHLVGESGAVSGKWRNAAGDKWGQMSGEVNGNLFKFEWHETKIGLVGPSATTNGRGYFVYSRPKGENVNDEIHGEWGLGDQFTGVTWDATKQRNMTPDPDSVVPDETQRLEGGGWDQSGKKSGGSSGSGSGSGSSDGDKDDEWN